LTLPQGRFILLDARAVASDRERPRLHSGGFWISKVLARTKICQNPHQRPAKTKKSSAPLFHAATKRVRDDLLNTYHAFVAAFREAAEKLKAGNRNAAFPIDSFPPGLPFVSG
jgi:hypothetical protein